MVCVNDTLYQIAENQPELAGRESEFVFLGEIESRVSAAQRPEENFQANDEIVGASVYQYGEDVVVRIDGTYWLYENKAGISSGVTEFHGRRFRKADLSAETIEWLEWYDALSPEEQRCVSGIPSELYTYGGTGSTGENAPETEPCAE